MPGLFYVGESLKEAPRVITFHETEVFLIWVGAARMNGGPLQVTTMTLDVRSSYDEAPTKRQCRRRLAMIPWPKDDNLEDSSSQPGMAFRAVPWRDILDSWITLVSEAELREERQIRYGLVTADSLSRGDGTTAGSMSLGLGSISSQKRDAIFVAYLYAQESALNPRRAASRVAVRLGVDVRDVYVALQVARRNDWLTTVKKGQSGGRLTGLGMAACEEFAVEARLGDLFGNRK